MEHSYKEREKYKIQFDLVNIPSKGIFYPNKPTSIPVRYLTTVEENILTTPSLLENKEAITTVLKLVVMDETISINDLLLCDRDAIVLFLRSTAYGDSFPIFFTCPKCNKESEVNFTLSSFGVKDIKIQPDDNGFYKAQLPKSKKSVLYRHLTVKDEELMFDADTFTMQLEKQIISIDGVESREYVKKFVKNMPISDSSFLRKYINETEPGFDKTVELECEFCKNTSKTELQLDYKLLKMDANYRKNIMEEIFLITYYSQGGITRNDVMDMTVSERRWHIQRISEEIDKKNQAEEKAIQKSKSKR